MRYPFRHSVAETTPAGLSKTAEAAAATLPPLLVAAERVAATVAQGVHGRRRVGQGDTFWQFRRYQTGDAATQIDWRQSAKSQAAFVRENEWEAAQTVWLWTDGSASMRYASEREWPEKAERAAVLTLALAILLNRGGERVALLDRGIGPSAGRAVLGRIAVALAAAAVDERTANMPALALLPRHARLALIGDFLSPPAEVERVVRAFAGRGVRGHIVQVLDPAEETLPFRGRVRFRGLEGEGELLVGRTEALREDYLAILANHRAAISDIARSAGWTYAMHRTDRPPQAALLALHSALALAPGL
ncbi:MAG: DUF58 domain-containing protein [Alphaproteobacteria bacterium]|nr:DUF58 domain-containing protein [Alphaproteobacteria bacterium]